MAVTKHKWLINTRRRSYSKSAKNMAGGFGGFNFLCGRDVCIELEFDN